MPGPITDEDCKRLSGKWDRAKVIGGERTPIPELGIGFNDNEDPFAVMASVARIAKWWVEKNTN